MRRARHVREDMLATALVGVLVAAAALPVAAQGTPAATAAQPASQLVIAAAPVGATRNGREIYRKFREGLAEPECAPDASARWSTQFAAAPARLASSRDDVLPLFGFVVDALREAHLPTEYALIPFVESGYKPGARSPSGPAGLWQMITITALSHKVPIRNGYDGRLSPVDSTTAAVRYLRTLHGMFAGDWRLAAMAYNAGEYRILGALKRGGQVARDARPEQLPGLAPITHAYVRKLHALSCLLAQAEDDEDWLRAIDRPVPHLKAVTLPAGARGLDQWAARHGQDAGQLRRLNPLFAAGNPGTGTLQLLAATAPSGAVQALPKLLAEQRPRGLPDQDRPDQDRPDRNRSDQGRSVQERRSQEFVGDAATAGDDAPTRPRRHTVVHGDSASSIARRYGIRLGDLLERNGLTLRSVLRAGLVLQIDRAAAAGD